LASVALGSLVVQQLFFVGFAFSLKAIVDDVTERRSASQLAFVLALLLAGFVLAALATVAGEWAAARLVNGIRRDLYDHLLRLSPAYFLTTPPGKVLNRFANDLKALEGGSVQGFLDAVVLVVSTVFALPLLFWLDWRLALITCLTLPVVVVVVDRRLPRWVRANDALSASELDLVNAVQDTIRAQQLVRTFQLEPVLTERFDHLLGNQQQRSVDARVLGATVGKGTSLGVLFVQLLVIVVGAELAVHGAMTAGSLVAFITVLGVVAKSIYDLANRDLPLLAEAGRGSKGLADLLGANGSGKSTVLSLLMRFYDPENGAVRVDGRDLRQVTQKSFRSQMSVVLQGNFVFNNTIRENIRIGNPDASDEEVVEAARRAELHDC
jgi:ATP-binding cassette subfamily B protein